MPEHNAIDVTEIESERALEKETDQKMVFGHETSSDMGLPTGDTDALFEGDTGDLDVSLRRSLTMLLRNAYVSELENADVYRCVCDERVEIARELANLGLVLTVNERYGVAYATQANVLGRNPLITLKTNMPVSRDVSVLLVSLRVQQHAMEARGAENWFVEREDMEAMLKSGPYAKDKDGKRMSTSLTTALNSLESLGYLKAVDSRKERFRIMPILPAVFSLERTYELLEMFEEIIAHDSRAQRESADEEKTQGS